MSDAAEILQSVQIGLNVVIFLLNTDRGPQATELCVECAVLLQNLDRGSHLDISDVISNAYYGISGNTNAERYTKKLLYTFHHAGIGTVCMNLKEMQKAKKHLEKTLTIAIEIGHRKKEGRANGNLGTLFHSLDEYQKAKECYRKALAIAIEISDRQEEGKRNGNLGEVFCSLGEYQMAKECYGKALAIAIEIGDRNWRQTRRRKKKQEHRNCVSFPGRISEGKRILQESICNRDGNWRQKRRRNN